MKFITFYLRLIGISVFLFLLGLSVFFGYFVFGLNIDEGSELVACLVSTLLIFAGLHYITLTAFGFIDTEDKLMWVPTFIHSIPFLVMFGLLFIISKVYLDNYREELAKRPVSYGKKLEIMNSTESTLVEKLAQLKMEVGGLYEPRMAVSFKENSFTNRKKNGAEMTEFYEQFALSDDVIRQLNARYITREKYPHLALANGQTRTVEDVNDSIVGYLPSRDVFVVMKTDYDNTTHFESINRANGDRLPGIPLIADSTNRFFADLNFRYRHKTADFQIFAWKRGSNREYKLLHHEIVPLGLYHTTMKRCAIKNIRWRKDSLLFDLVAHDQNKLKEVAFILSKLGN